MYISLFLLVRYTCYMYMYITSVSIVLNWLHHPTRNIMQTLNFPYFKDKLLSVYFSAVITNGFVMI